jgi:hypothetical protein
MGESWVLPVGPEIDTGDSADKEADMMDAVVG